MNVQTMVCEENRSRRTNKFTIVTESKQSMEQQDSRASACSRKRGSRIISEY